MKRRSGAFLRRILGCAVLGLASMGLVSCGKVASGPISPLVNPPLVYDFEADLQGWIVMDGTSPNTSGMTAVYTNEKTLNSYGALKATVDFNNQGEKIILGKTLASPIDLTGKMISLWVYWDSGLSSQGGKTGAQLFVKDTADTWANGAFLALEKGAWNQVLFNTAAPGYDAGTDMSIIDEIGVQIVADIGIFTPGVIYLDNYAY